MEHWAGYNRTGGTLGRLGDGRVRAGVGQELGVGGHRERHGASGVGLDVGTGREGVRRSGTGDLGQA
jgi:hypothetical protein